MGNQQSNKRSEDLSSHQPGASSAVSHSHIHGDRSGNSDSINININIGNSGSNSISIGNTTNNAYYNHGGADSPPHHAKILQCLYTSPYEEHRRRIREPVEGTCSWVTEHPKYKDWLEGRASGLLWLSADPGCGKSVIASFLVGHLQDRPGAMVCYFFFKDDNHEQRSAAFALCAILHQIFREREHLIEFAKGDFKAKGAKFTQEVDTLWDIFVKAVAEWGCGEVICVVDALDECDERSLIPLIRHITRLSGSQNFNTPLKFLVTSRPYHRIERELGSPETTIRLKGENEATAIGASVTLVIGEGIKNLESFWQKPGGLGYLRNLLESAADRTFLWISLVLDILESSEDGSREEFTRIATTAPRDLAELYTNILDKTTNPEKARRILNIVVAVARPLTLGEMYVAFRMRRDNEPVETLEELPCGFERTVKVLCGLFVRVIDSKIYLVHQTAREFLLKGSLVGQGDWQYTLCPKDSNFALADTCISYLSLEEFENHPLEIGCYTGVENYLQEYAFLDYAARYWAKHFRDSQDRQMELFEFTRLICEAGSKRFLTWLQVYWYGSWSRGGCPQDWTHLMIASWLGQGAVVERLLGEGGDINARSERHGSALNIAALRGDGDMTEMLLRNNVKAYIDGEEYSILDMKRSELERLLEEWVREWERRELREMLLGRGIGRGMMEGIRGMMEGMRGMMEGMRGPEMREMRERELGLDELQELADLMIAEWNPPRV